MNRRLYRIIGTCFWIAGCGGAPADPGHRDGPSAAKAGACRADPVPFWLAFRKALLAGDPRAVQRMSIAMVEQRGQLDGERMAMLSSATLGPMLAALLRADTGLRATPYSQRALVAATEKPDAVHCDRKDGEFSVGTMSFRLVPTGWKLASITVEQ